jgi:hypothetical protein
MIDEFGGFDEFVSTKQLKGLDESAVVISF